jgi:hypothetical protein
MMDLACTEAAGERGVVAGPNAYVEVEGNRVSIRFRVRLPLRGVWGVSAESAVLRKTPPRGFEQHVGIAGVFAQPAVGAHRRLRSLIGVHRFKFSKSWRTA